MSTDDSMYYKSFAACRPSEARGFLLKNWWQSVMASRKLMKATENDIWWEPWTTTGSENNSDLTSATTSSESSTSESLSQFSSQSSANTTESVFGSSSDVLPSDDASDVVTHGSEESIIPSSSHSVSQRDREDIENDTLSEASSTSVSIISSLSAETIIITSYATSESSEAACTADPSDASSKISVEDRGTWVFDNVVVSSENRATDAESVAETVDSIPSRFKARLYPGTALPIRR